MQKDSKKINNAYIILVITLVTNIGVHCVTVNIEIVTIYTIKIAKGF